jgi:allantoin racemase
MARRMRLLVLNPNTTQAMTDAVAAQVRALAGPAVCVEGLTAATGCAVIDSAQSFTIGAAAARHSLQEHLRHSETPADGILLACFGDPGLAELRRLTDRPVVALAEAAILSASAERSRFAILTCGLQWTPMLDDCVESLGVSAHYAGTWALPFNGRALIANPQLHASTLKAHARAAADAGARKLILGGAAFAGLHFLLDERLQLIDPVEVATRDLLARS